MRRAASWVKDRCERAGLGVEIMEIKNEVMDIKEEAMEVKSTIDDVVLDVRNVANESGGWQASAR